MCYSKFTRFKGMNSLVRVQHSDSNAMKTRSYTKHLFGDHL